MEPTLTAYGTWNGGRFMHFGERLPEDRYISALRRAYDRGIRTFLTADAYGTGEADTLLGKALEGLPRDSYCLAGMIGHDFYQGERVGAKGFPRFTDPNLRGPDGYADYLKMAAETSLARLGETRFDLLMLHNPDSIGYTHEAVWNGLRALKEEGLADLLGIAPGPANGFSLDIIECFERFHDAIDWAMIILNPLEPWPGGLCLPAAEEFDVKVITRVVDHGGLFHDDVKPGHPFGRTDHRVFRPAGWVEEGCGKLEKLRPFAEKHGLTMLQFACRWNLGHPAVECVVPTIIQESGDGARAIEDKIDDLAALPETGRPTPEEIAETSVIGDNKGCMPLKGGSRQFQGQPQADQWPLSPELETVAQRWHINPDADIYCAHDPRDKREKGMPARGVPQAIDRRLFLQLHVFTGSDKAKTDSAIDVLSRSGLECVVYADVNDPRGLGLLTLSEDPGVFAGAVRDLFEVEPFPLLDLRPEMTMIGRTYGFGRETDIEHWMIRRPIEQAMNPEWPWAVWYPLRRKGSFYQLPKREQGEILKEHGMIGFQYGGAGYAGDIRLECFGLDRADNEFVLGLMSPRLDWLSKLIGDMRPTVQTSQYLESLGPFFVGKVLFRSR